MMSKTQSAACYIDVWFCSTLCVCVWVFDLVLVPGASDNYLTCHGQEGERGGQIDLIHTAYSTSQLWSLALSIDGLIRGAW